MEREHEYVIYTEVKLVGEFQDDTQADADPTSITLRVRKPDGSITVYIEPEIVHDDIGLYHLIIVPDQEGRWYYYWQGTGVITAAGEKSFIIKDSAFFSAP